jgi:dual-specificity kinase
MSHSRKRRHSEVESVQSDVHLTSTPDSEPTCNGTPQAISAYSSKIKYQSSVLYSENSFLKRSRRERETEPYYHIAYPLSENFAPTHQWYISPHPIYYEHWYHDYYQSSFRRSNYNSPIERGRQGAEVHSRQYRYHQERGECRHTSSWRYRRRRHSRSRSQRRPERYEPHRHYATSRRSRHQLVETRPRSPEGRDESERRVRETERDRRYREQCGRYSRSQTANGSGTSSCRDSPNPNTTTEYDAYAAFHDKHGHYIVTLGDNLTPRWKILSVIGEGTFGKVLECWDRQTRQYVAIKVIRAVEKYRDAARVEIDILRRINRYDPDAQHGCIKLADSFEFRGHVCLVFPKYGLSLYDYIRLNDYQPLAIDSIRRIASELFRSVAFMHSIKLVHTDLKPENILFRDPTYRPDEETRNSGVSTKPFPGIVIIDFGNATFEEQHHTRIVCTRHYRAPEVLLDRGWSYPLDIWSIGCILIELYTGEPLFQTHHNQEHLDMMQHILGPFPPHFLAASRYRDNLHSLPPNITKLTPLRDLVPSTSPLLRAFYDLLCRTLEYEPQRRITARDALNHPFLTLPLESSSHTVPDTATKPTKTSSVSLPSTSGLSSTSTPTSTVSVTHSTNQTSVVPSKPTQSGL